MREPQSIGERIANVIAAVTLGVLIGAGLVHMVAR